MKKLYLKVWAGMIIFAFFMLMTFCCAQDYLWMDSGLELSSHSEHLTHWGHHIGSQELGEDCHGSLDLLAAFDKKKFLRFNEGNQILSKFYLLFQIPPVCLKQELLFLLFPDLFKVKQISSTYILFSVFRL